MKEYLINITDNFITNFQISFQITEMQYISAMNLNIFYCKLDTLENNLKHVLERIWNVFQKDSKSSSYK